MSDLCRLSTMRRSAVRPGSAMILVLVAVAIASVLGVSFLAASATSTAIAEHVENQAKARQIAESGIAIAIDYIERTPTWMVDRVNGAWVTNQRMCGGTFSLNGAFTASVPVASPTVLDASFEQQAGALPTPMLAPPMSGIISGWQVQRASLLGTVTGLTVPHIGVDSSAFATDGGRLGYVLFPASVIGSAVFSQTLASSLEADTAYVLKVDVIKLSVVSVLADLELRVLAGSAQVASSSDPSLLTILDLNTDAREYVIRFTTGAAPPSGPIRIELHARSSLGVLAGVGFDHVRLEIENDDPVILTSTGQYGGAVHTATATVLPPNGAGPARIVKWSEP